MWTLVTAGLGNSDTAQQKIELIAALVSPQPVPDADVSLPRAWFYSHIAAAPHVLPPFSRYRSDTHEGDRLAQQQDLVSRLRRESRVLTLKHNPLPSAPDGNSFLLQTYLLLSQKHKTLSLSRMLGHQLSLDPLSLCTESPQSLSRAGQLVENQMHVWP